MKVLIALSSYPFSSKTSTTLVATQNILELTKKHDIHLICFQEETQTEDNQIEVKSTNFVLRERYTKLFALWRVFWGLIIGNPVLATLYESPLMRKKINELDQAEHFDVILLYGFEFLLNCPQSMFSKLIAIIEDPLMLKAMRLKELSGMSLKERYHLFVAWLGVHRLEKKMFPMAKRVVLFSKADIEDCKNKYGYNNLYFVPYGVSAKTPREILGINRRKRGMIIISGNMYHFPNVHGVLFFLREVFPIVLKGYPDSVLWVVGSEPHEKIKIAALSFGARVVITGRVPDVSVYIKEAMVSVCPVRLKIGVQTKVLESLTCGTPVVTTSEGNSGVCGVPGRDLWVEDSPGMLAKRIVGLLRGEDWAFFSENGLRFVQDHFSWAASASEIDSCFQEIKQENVLT